MIEGDSNSEESKKISYLTTILGFDNHAAIEIPEVVLAALGANRRAPLKITVHNHSYQGTATVVDGKCMVVFPTKDRTASGAAAGDTLMVDLELDSGYRNVDIPDELLQALITTDTKANFDNLAYFKRKDFARQIREAKAVKTKNNRVDKIIEELKRVPIA